MALKVCSTHLLTNSSWVLAGVQLLHQLSHRLASTVLRYNSNAAIQVNSIEATLSSLYLRGDVLVFQILHVRISSSRPRTLDARRDPLWG